MFRDQQYGDFSAALRRLFELEAYSDSIKEQEVLGIERGKWGMYLHRMREDLDYPRDSVSKGPEWVPTLGEVIILYKMAFWRGAPHWDIQAANSEDHTYQKAVAQSFLKSNDVHPRRWEDFPALNDAPTLPGASDPLWDLYEYPHEIAEQIFFFAVNAGKVQCVREIQRALSTPQSGWRRGRLEIDGRMGRETKRALRHADPEKFLVAFTAHVEGFYRLLEATKDFPADAVIKNRIYGG